MGKGKDKKGFYLVAGSARSEAAKALIVPFDILYSIIATGAMLNGKDFSRENQRATLTCLGLVYAVTSVAFLLANATVNLCKAYKNKWRTELFKEIGNFILDLLFVIGTNIIYLVGDSKTEVSTDSAAEERDLTVQSIIYLIAAKLLFNFWPPIKNFFNNIWKFCCKSKADPKKESHSAEVKFSKSIFYATVRTLSLVPEVDTMYTTLGNLVSLTRNDCRMRKYNVLWVMYGGIIGIIIMKFINAFCEAFHNFVYDKSKTDWKKNLCRWITYSIITSVLAVICIACYFVADNELPLDCSPHFHITEKDKTLETRNYTFRIVLLVASFIFSSIILIMGGICWGRFIYLYWKEFKKQESTEMKSEDDTPNDSRTAVN